MNEERIENLIAQSAGFNGQAADFFGTLLSIGLTIVLIAIIAGTGASITIGAFDITEQIAKGLVIAGWLGTSCYITSQFETVDTNARGLAQVAYALLIHARHSRSE
jgi:hypothetical protein